MLLLAGTLGFQRIEGRFDSLNTLIDQEYEHILKEGVSNMKENPEEVKSLMRVTWTARALERIGDHAKNISEYVVYMVEAKNYSK